MKKNSSSSIDLIRSNFQLARAQKPAYAALYSLLEPLFLLQAEAAATIHIPLPEIDPQVVKTRWESGFPLLNRWEFSIDPVSAGRILTGMLDAIPAENEPMITAYKALSKGINDNRGDDARIWRSFLHHEDSPWSEWIDAQDVDIASLLFLARSCTRPSVDWVAQQIVDQFAVPGSWLKGYCPVCGSLPSLLFLEGTGERVAHCSWCSTRWGLHRLQCPSCDNRNHESLGYIQVEAEPQYRIQYCTLCRTYFRLIDARDRVDPPFAPIEEWSTLHLDLLAQRAGWKQAPSPSPAVYGAGE